jgi:hypothetical protein
MVLLIEEKLLLGGESGIFLIQFDNRYYNYHINQKIKLLNKY